MSFSIQISNLRGQDKGVIAKISNDCIKDAGNWQSAIWNASKQGHGSIRIQARTTT